MRRMVLTAVGLMVLYACSRGGTPEEPGPDAFVLFRSLLVIGTSGDTTSWHSVAIMGTYMDSIPQVTVNGVRFPDTAFSFELFIVGAQMDSPRIGAGETLRVHVQFRSIAGDYVTGEAISTVPPVPQALYPVERGDTIYFQWTSPEQMDGYQLDLYSWCYDASYNYHEYVANFYLRDTIYGVPADSVCPYDTINSGAITLRIKSIRGPIFSYDGNFEGVDGKLLAETRRDYRFDLPLGD